MAIPRLPPAANPYTTEITVNERERPYFELFYQAKKKPGETPDEFAKRLIAMDVRNYHISQYLPAEREAIEQITKDAEAATQADIEAFSAELE